MPKIRVFHRTIKCGSNQNLAVTEEAWGTKSVYPAKMWFQLRSRAEISSFLSNVVPTAMVDSNLFQNL